MSRFIKYLILCLAVSFLADASGISIYSPHNESDESLIYVAEVSTTLSETDHDLCLQRQVSSGSNVNVQWNSRRTDNAQRHFFEFVKSGKTVNPTVIYNLLNTSLNNRSAFSDPSHILIRLCKFII